MSSTTCGFCKRYSHMTAIWSEQYTSNVTIQGSPTTVTQIQGIARCDQCKRTSMAIGIKPGSGSDSRERLENTPDANLRWYPSVGTITEFPDVPDHIAAAATEAHSVASISAPMAAILMARTVVEATAKEKGILSGPLVQKIDELAKGGHIRESTREAAHEIRHFGNDMAHGDIADPTSSEDAEEVLTLMDEVLREVFQGPAITARIKAKRLAP